MTFVSVGLVHSGTTDSVTQSVQDVILTSRKEKAFLASNQSKICIVFSQFPIRAIREQFFAFIVQQI